MSVKSIFQVCKHFLNHPLGRGMLTNSITLPAACLIQQFYDKKNLDDINWKKCVRFSLYGIFISSPMAYFWMRIANRIWQKQTLASGLQKALVEQVTYAPIAILMFFLIMDYAELRSFDKAREEVGNKVWDSYKVALGYWPFVQTINFTVIPERNRLVFFSLCGFLWVMFLAYVDAHGSPLKSKVDTLKSDEPSN